MGTNMADLELVELYTWEDFMKDLSDNSLLKTGLVKTSKSIKKKVNAADFGLSLRIPYIPAQAFDEGQIIDDSDDVIEGLGVTFGHMTAALSNRAQAWQYANIVDQVKPGIAMTDIVSKLGRDWLSGLLERILEHSLEGIIASNKANEGADLVFDNGTDALTWETIVKARNKAHKAKFKYIVMGSDVAGVLESKYPEKFWRPNDELGYGMSTFGGMRVIISDKLSKEADIKKTIYFLADGAIIQEFKDISDTTGSDSLFKFVEKKDAGNGGGKKKFIMNVADLTHVDGYTLKVAPTKEAGYTLAELANPDLYERVAPQENTGIFALETEAK